MTSLYTETCTASSRKREKEREREIEIEKEQMGKREREMSGKRLNNWCLAFAGHQLVLTRHTIKGVQGGGTKLQGVGGHVQCTTSYIYTHVAAVRLQLKVKTSSKR